MRARGTRFGSAIAALSVGLALSCASWRWPMPGDTGIRTLVFDMWDVRCPSGLRVIFERTPGARIAGVTTLVGAGSLQDPPGREGLAHLVEHLAFRTSRGAEQAALDTRLVAMGASYNATTAFDRTLYTAFVPHQSLRALLVAEGERLLQPLAGVDDVIFGVERDVVRNELREHYETNFMRETFNATRRAVFPPGHAYRRPIIGTHGSLTALTLEDASAFVKAHYRPEAMTMVVVGDMDRKDAEKLLREALPPELYGDDRRPRGVAPRPASPAGEPPVTASGPLLRARASVAGPELWIAWSTPGGYQVDRSTSEMWAWLADNNFHWGRLDDTDISSVDFFVSPSSLVSLFICRVRLVDGKHPEESLRQVVDALPWIGGDEIYPEQRFQGLRLGFLRRMALETESARSRSEELAEYAHFTGDLNAFGAQVEAIKAVNPGVAQTFARRYLGRERARAVLIEPLGGALAAAEPVPLAARFVDDARYPPIPPVTLDGLAKVRPLAGLHTVKLKNGLEVIILKRPGAAVVTASLGFHGGRSSARPGVARTALENIELNWEESPSAFGIGFSMSAGLELSTLTMYAGARNVPRALDMMSFLVRSYDLEWPSEKFQTVKLPLLRRQQISKGERAFFETLYVGHGYGSYATPDQIAGLKRAELQRWLDQTLVPANAALVVVGDIDPLEAEAAARDAFGGWSSSGVKIAAPPPAQRKGTAPPAPGAPGSGKWTMVISNSPGATQTELKLACLLPPGDARSKAVYEIAADLVGSVLERRLRQQVGATYGVHVYASVLRGGTSVLLGESVIDNARLPLAMNTLRRFWIRTEKHSIDADHVRRIRDGRAVASALGAETSATIAATLLDSWNRGWPLDWLDRAPSDLVGVQPAEVEATLRSCAQDLVLLLTGDEKVIKASWTAGPEEAAPPPPKAPSPAAAPTPDAAAR